MEKFLSKSQLVLLVMARRRGHLGDRFVMGWY